MRGEFPDEGDQAAFCRGIGAADRGASGPPHPNIPNPGIRGGIPAELDCPIRKLAYEYAVKIQGSLRGIDGLKVVHGQSNHSLVGATLPQ